MANMFDNLKQVGQMKKQAAQFEKLLRTKTVEAVSQRGEVRVKINGKMELLEIDISADALVPEKKDYLERVIKNTMAKAQSEVEKIISSEVKAQMGSLKMPF